MSGRKHEAVVCRILNEACSKDNLVIGHELLTDKSVLHSPGSDIKGALGWRCIATGFLSGLPDDLQVALEDIVAKGYKVAVRWTARGTQAGWLPAIGPTGRAMQRGGG
jgi:hypothetical protein